MSTTKEQEVRPRDKRLVELAAQLQADGMEIADAWLRAGEQLAAEAEERRADQRRRANRARSAATAELIRRHGPEWDALYVEAAAKQGVRPNGRRMSSTEVEEQES